MAISSAKASDTRITTAAMTPPEEKEELSLRPNSLREYIGQEWIKSQLQIAIDAAKIRKESVGHILFYGPPGLGKTTLSTIIAREMHATLRHSSGPAIEKPADLISLLTSLQPGDVLFIDEIHRLRTNIEEILYSAMEDWNIDIMIGSGTGASAVKMPIARFTLVGATTKLASVSNPLRDRFEHVIKLDFYDEKELSTITRRSFALLGITQVSPTACDFTARRSRGTPRIANRFVRILRDHATVGRDISRTDECEAIFWSLGIDEKWLDGLDRQYLQVLKQASRNRPMGLSTIASVIGEEEATIEDVVEPYLLKMGLIEKTPRGRCLTDAGETYATTL